jgi:biopolymer transport protein ExbB/TolQ
MSNPLYQAIANVASVLEIPVVIAALVALAMVIVELGRFLVERRSRSRIRIGPARTRELERAAGNARRVLAVSGVEDAAQSLRPVAWSAALEQTHLSLLEHTAEGGDENFVAKDLADFDLECQRRLSRTRLLVRLGPALGLMGTLIPLAPALDGLAKGNVQTLTDNLQVAFSITVLGLLIGGVAFGLSLARDTMYSQDYSDLEFVAAVLTEDAPTRDRVTDPS